MSEEIPYVAIGPGEEETFMLKHICKDCGSTVEFSAAELFRCGDDIDRPSPKCAKCGRPVQIGPMMPTNDERREVAARLRNYENLRESFRESPICAFLDVLGVGYLDWKVVCNRLADLIDPEPERTCRYEHIEGTWYKTSCRERYDGVVPPNYCPNCGAKVVE